jgi:hypothetical protein
MKPIVFLGPTLAVAEAATLLDADFCGPAARGDIFRAAARRPPAIGLVDGYFHSRPAVWHKEIAWALSQGIAVFGSACMGALRATEMADLGMRGIGLVFEQFRSGLLEDDDEVAIVHGPAELDYLAASEAMVNIRATLQAAVDEAVLTVSQAQVLTHIAKGIFYPERDYSRLLEMAQADPRAGDAAALARLRAWLPLGRVDQKRLDAQDMLTAMRRALAAPDDQPAPRPVFEESLGWSVLLEETRHLGRLDAQDVHVLAGLRQDPVAAGRAEAAALGWLLADDAAPPGGPVVNAEALLQASRDFCDRHGLADRAAVEAWLACQGLSQAELDRLLLTDAWARQLGARRRVRHDQALIDHLHWSGDYQRLLRLP